MQGFRIGKFSNIFMAESPFNPGYLESVELKKLGFGSIGKNTKIAKNSTIIGLENIFIGDDVRIDGFSTIIAAEKGRLLIGNNVFIGGYCFLSCGENITMSDFSGLAQGVRIYTRTDDYTGKTLTNQTIPKKFTGIKSGKVTLEKHVIVGSGSVILPGVTIKTGSSVGALSLVTKDLAEWGIYCGSPAKKIKNRSKKLLLLEEQYLQEKQ
jgi:acetyltransferase-like isoleucine patch superfamily enzyme